MDEATSGFDKEADAAFIKLLCEELEEKTVIFITHRYEELDGVEKVFELSDGVLTQKAGILFNNNNSTPIHTAYRR